MKKFLRKFLAGKRKGPKQAERSPRVRLPLEDDFHFLLVDGTKFPILNLSESGVAISCAHRPLLDDEPTGTLAVGTEKALVRMRVVWRSSQEVGARFEGETVAVRSLLRKLFKEEICATEMSEVAPERLMQDEPGKPRWFYAPGNYELFFMELEGKVSRFEMEWNGQFLAYVKGALRFGIIDAEDRHKGQAMSTLVKWREAPSPEDIRKALRILENIPRLESDLRAQMKKIIAG